MSASILAAIVAGSRRSSDVREARTPLRALARRARPAAPEGAFSRALLPGGGAALRDGGAALRDGGAALRDGGAALQGGGAALQGPRIIAECKRRSPSNGVLRASYDPAAIASSYERAGAAAISVLTEASFFDGALAHLEYVREAVSIPVLRKDFIVTRYQIAEARAAGADAILLIVGALADGELRDMLAVTRDHGMDALVEAHDAQEVERALAAGARIIGVNSRNLHTLSVDTGVFFELAPMMPVDVIAVAESGIRDAAMLTRLGETGYHACLIGERFMKSADPGHALRAMVDGS